MFAGTACARWQADSEEAKRDRQAAESELDATEHHIADMQTAIERLTAELDQARASGRISS